MRSYLVERLRARDKPQQGIVVNTLNLHRNGAVGFIDWLGVGGRLIARAMERVSTVDGVGPACLGAGDVVCRQIQPMTRTRSQTSLPRNKSAVLLRSFLYAIAR